MIAISIANSIGSRRSSAPAVVVPVATAATGVGDTSFTANWNAFAGANYYLLDVSLNSSFSSFVGSYQNYVTIGTSQLVSGLTPNTTYYYRLRAATGVDSDAAAFFSRVYTAGGVLSYTEVTATETLVANMKSAGIWTAMKAVYPMVGASAAACSQNLKSSSFTGSFSSGWTFASTGVTPNGTSAYFDTGFNPSTNLTIPSSHQSQYQRNNATDSGFRGVWDGGGATLRLEFAVNSSSFGGSSSYWSNGAGGNPSPLANSNGFILAKSLSAGISFYRNGTSFASTTSGSGNFPNRNYYFGALNNNGSADFYSNMPISFGSLGDGLTDTQASNFYTAVQTFNTILNRSVGTPIVSDADAQAYINRVYTAGGTLTNTEANAVNQLVIDMKAAGIWTAMKAVYPMVGSSAAACAQNLKSSSYTGTFSSGWTFASTGVTPNGTGAYMDTGLNENTVMTLNSCNVGIYTRTNNTNYLKYDFGVDELDTRLTSILFNYNNSSYFRNQNLTITTFATPTNVQGFWQNNRTAASVQKTFFNGSVYNSTTDASVGKSNLNYYLGALNLNGAAILFGNNQYAFCFVSDGLTDTQASNFYTCVQTFNTSLSRQV